MQLCDCIFTDYLSKSQREYGVVLSYGILFEHEEEKISTKN